MYQFVQSAEFPLMSVLIPFLNEDQYIHRSLIAVYLESCCKGDPGSNDSYRAGLTAEQLGDLPAAIRYLRLSRYSGALERADRLESQLGEQT